MGKSETPVLEVKTYAGILAVNGETARVTFRLSAAADCRLHFDLDPVDTRTYGLVIKDTGRPGQTTTEFTLSGISADGHIVTSDRMFFGGTAPSSYGHKMLVSAYEATVTCPLANATVKPALRLWFRAFKSFRNPTIATPLGNLRLYGQERDVEPDDMSGNVSVEATSSESEPRWFQKADDFLHHMHNGLAFAHGGRLQTPRLDRGEGGIYTCKFFSGSGYEPEFPVQYHLNHGPFVRALVDRYFGAGPLPEALWTALGWMQSDTTFDEIRFLTAMTALETIIENQLPERKGTTISRDDFKPLRDKLKAVVLADEGLKRSADIFQRGIDGLNRKSLAEKIDALFDHFKISRQDFEGNAVGALIGLRNDIVHRGAVRDSVDVWPHIILIRELITRILLREIGFKGRYCCYIGGRHDRNFQ